MGQSSIVRLFVAALVVLFVAGCAYETGPAGQPTASSVNPFTGSHGGNGAK